MQSLSYLSLVTSGVTLVAFIVAVGAAVYRHNNQRTERLISTAPESQRGRLVKQALESYPIDTEKLSGPAALKLAIEQLHFWQTRNLITAIVVGLIAILLAVVATVAIYHDITPTSEPTTEKSGDKPNGDKPVGATPKAELTPELRQEIDVLSGMLQLLTEKAISRQGIIGAITKYVGTHTENDWTEVLHYLKQIDDENKDLTTAKQKPLHYLTTANNQLHQDLVGILDAKAKLSRRLDKLKALPHTDEQIAELSSVADEFKQLQATIKKVVEELRQFVTNS